MSAHATPQPLPFWRGWLMLVARTLTAVYGALFNSKSRRARKEMDGATQYAEWYQAAANLDRLQNNTRWKVSSESSVYDHMLITHRLRQLRTLDDPEDIVAWVTEGLSRDVGGINNPALYHKCHTGTKSVIESYYEEVQYKLRFVSEEYFPHFTNDQKVAFFREVRHIFGRSALLLSGGAFFGLYHVGVVQELCHQNLLPRIISGTNAGSLVAAVLAVHTDDELLEVFDKKGNISWAAFEGHAARPDNVWKRLSSFLRRMDRFHNKGVLMDVRLLEAFTFDNIGNTTFREAHARTQRVLNIAVQPSENSFSSGMFLNPHQSQRSRRKSSILLNYLTAPDVLIASACAASCSFPLLYEPVELLAKDSGGKVVPFHPPASGLKWSDACFKSDLPMARLSEMFNVNHFIVSQANPHVLPFIENEGRTARRISNGFGLCPLALSLAKSEIKHRLLQLVHVGALPTALSRQLGDVLCQKYSGDITILAPVKWSDYLKVISVPSEGDLRECMVRGQRGVWDKIALIRDSTCIERTLDRCLATLRAPQGGLVTPLH